MYAEKRGLHLGEDLGQRLAGSDLGVHVLELLGRDLAVLHQDRPELIARVVRRAEEDPADAEVERLLVGRAFHLERARRALAVKVYEKEGKGLGINAAADREGFGHRLPVCRNAGNLLRHNILTRQAPAV